MSGVVRERGSASIIVLGITGALLILTISGLALGSAVIASHRARSAGDLAALAGASAVMRGEATGAGCAVAGRVAAANGARLSRCGVVAGASLRVEVLVSPSLRGLGQATAVAVAGPAESAPLGGRGDR